MNSILVFVVALVLVGALFLVASPQLAVAATSECEMAAWTHWAPWAVVACAWSMIYDLFGADPWSGG